MDVMRATAKWLAAGTWLLAATAAAQTLDDGAEILGENVLLDCAQPSLMAVECDFRLVDPAPVTGVAAYLGELELPTPEVFGYPQPGSVSAVLFLIDTSDPRRAPAVQAAVRHVQRILQSAGEHHLFALATFDSKLQVRAAPGSTASTIETALGEVRAEGRTTELYRNTLAAVNLIGSYPADRRSVMIFSDGQAEDKAYFHADVVNAARRQGVSIDGLGYPRSVALSVHLQTLRRMADETGGRFVEGSPAFVLPEAFLAAPFTALDSGGTLAVDLASAVDAGATSSGVIDVEIALQAGRAAARVDVRLPEPPPPPPPEPVVVQPVAPIAVQPEPETTTAALDSGATSLEAAPASTAPADTGGTPSTTNSGAGTGATSAQPPAPPASTSASATETAPATASTTTDADSTSSGASTTSGVSPTTPTAAPPPAAPVTTPTRALEVTGLGVTMTLNDVLTWAIAAAGVVMLFLLVLLVRVLRQRKAPAATPAGQPASAGTPANDDPGQIFAYLDAMDGSGDRHPITSAAFRIGRHADNELPISDPSMSRHHAQIQMKRDGTFTVTDLESMNGVFVNEKRVSTAPVNDGDLVELGDVRMRFGVARHDALGGDETVMVRTALPGEVGNRGAA